MVRGARHTPYRLSVGVNPQKEPNMIIPDDKLNLNSESGCKPVSDSVLREQIQEHHRQLEEMSFSIVHRLLTDGGFFLDHNLEHINFDEIQLATRIISSALNDLLSHTDKGDTNAS